VTQAFQLAGKRWVLELEPIDEHSVRCELFEEREAQPSEARGSGDLFSQLRAMLRLSKELPELSFGELSEHAVELVFEAMACDRTELWLFENPDSELFSEREEALQLMHHVGRTARSGGSRVLAEEVPILHMVRMQRQVERDDVATDPLLFGSRQLLQPGSRTVIFAGLFLQSSLVGLLVCHRETCHPWGPEARAFLSSVAVVLSLSLETGRRRQAERNLQEHVNALEAARARAEAADRAKSEFLAMMSHEIRTPMNGVMGFAQLLADTNLDEEQRSFLSTIRGSAEHLLVIINDILDFSKIEAGKLELAIAPVEVEAIVAGVLELFMATATERGLWLTLELDPSAPAHFIGDEGRLRQVVLNLVSNALKFTERGGVTVRVTGQLDDVRVSVHDTGVGIKPEDLERLGTEFTQVDTSSKRRFGGTGLGLAISKRLVKLMKGDFGVSSEVGKGSEFWFCVPGMSATGAPRPARPERVCLVEPEGAVARMWVAALSARYEVVRVDAVPERFDGALVVSASAPVPAGARVVRRGKGGSEGVWVPERLVRPTVMQEALARLGAPVATPRADAQGPQVQLYTGRRVLLVDDNTINQRLAERLLKRHGLEVAVAGNGLEAVDACLGREFDLVLMDCNMPEMDGLEATRTIRKREQGRRTPIVALTADAMDSERRQCVEAGMDDHFAKPIREEQLRDVLARFLVKAA
jgi:signal transduction histidine kinase/ActR/RegA family two-component response regulator